MSVQFGIQHVHNRDETSKLRLTWRRKSSDVVHCEIQWWEVQLLHLLFVKETHDFPHLRLLCFSFLTSPFCWLLVFSTPIWHILSWQDTKTMVWHIFSFSTRGHSWLFKFIYCYYQTTEHVKFRRVGKIKNPNLDFCLQKRPSFFYMIKKHKEEVW